MKTDLSADPPRDSTHELAEHFRAALELASFGFAIFAAVRDASGTITDFRWIYRNRAATQLATLESFGVDVRGRMLSEVAPGVHPHTLVARCAEVVASGVPASLETVASFGGVEHWFRIRIAQLGDGVAVTYEDITGERRKEREQAALVRAGELVLSLEPDATIEQLARVALPEIATFCFVDVVCDRGFERIAVAHADPSKALLVERMKRVYPVVDRGEGGIADVIATRQPRLVAQMTDEVLRQIACDDDHLEMLRQARVRSSLTVALGARGETFGALTLATCRRPYDARDIAFAEELARRASAAILNARLYAEARDAKARAEEASRVKDEFLATVSHELRTPLSAISGWASILADRGTRDPDTLAKGIAVIERNAQAQAQLVDDILDTARIVSGKLRIGSKQVDLAELCDQALDVVRVSAEARGVVIDVTSDRPAVIQGDPDRLRQVLWNLLSNAIKFSEPGGTVAVSVRRNEGGIAVEVRDTGRGIPRELLPHVFDRFRQGESASTRTRGGLGLGLAIVRHIVELHGGEVIAESEGPGRGATFTVLLPSSAKVQRSSDRPPTTDAPREELLRARDGASAPLEGLRVLVVDDESDARELLQWVLSARGASVEVASSAAEAFARLLGSSFDALVSDIGMPQEDGLSFVRRVRSSGGAASKIPAIAVTAYAAREDRARSLEAGFDAHVTKPAEPNAIVALVHDLALARRAG